MLLLATVLYNVLFVATVSVAAVWPKNYVRAVDLAATVGVAPSSVRDPAVPGRRERPGKGPCVGHHLADVGVGAKVLFNSAKMLKMGILVVFMHDYGHYVSLITLRESVTFLLPVIAL